MRRTPTEAERALWSMLRAGRLAGLKFKRQVPIGHYIADFVCIPTRLIVEADGSQHVASTYDARRDAFLRSRGFNILRFWNNDILNDREAVQLAILTAAAPSPSHALSRAGPSLSLAGEGHESITLA